jgi:hypothetical protein
VLTRTITGRQTTPLYWGHRWKTSDFGTHDANRQYDIRITRTSGAGDETRGLYGRIRPTPQPAQGPQGTSGVDDLATE